MDQSRGGARSADLLDNSATGLMLTEPDREHLFMLGLGCLPERLPEMSTRFLGSYVTSSKGIAGSEGRWTPMAVQTMR